MLKEILSKNFEKLKNEETKGEKLYQNGMKWLESKNYNKQKLEKKIKQEMKITDENVKII
jgi:hypothetical protein